MPTDQNAYNSRVTDESLEKRFRDTFRSQGGAELVNDLYASGVIVPVVDFTAAATGGQLQPELQQAWDFSTGSASVNNANNSIITNSGFWKIDIIYIALGSSGNAATVFLTDGFSVKTLFNANASSTDTEIDNTFVVFLRANDELGVNASTNARITASYRQIADVNGNLVNPSGFTSS